MYRYTLNDGNKYFSHETIVETDTWIHVAMIYFGGSTWRQAKAYKDGQTVGGSTMEWSFSAPLNYDHGELWIGNFSNQPTNGHVAKCQADELLIWNRKLEEDQISKISKM